MKRLLFSAIYFVCLTSFANAQTSLFDENNEAIIEEKEDARIKYSREKFDNRAKSIAENEKQLYRHINQEIEKISPKQMQFFIEHNEMMKQDMAKAEDKPAPKKIKVNTKNKKETREYMYNNFSTGSYDDLISDIEDEAKKIREENL